MAVKLDHPGTDGDGCLVARGNINSGYVLYIKQGRLHFDYNCFHDHAVISAAAPIDAGPHVLAASIQRAQDGAADVSLTVDNIEVAKGVIPRTLFMISSTGMDLGRSAAPVCDAYQPPFAYPGKIHKVVFDLPPSRRDADADKEDEAKVRAALSRQ